MVSATQLMSFYSHDLWKKRGAHVHKDKGWQCFLCFWKNFNQAFPIMQRLFSGKYDERNIIFGKRERFAGGWLVPGYCSCSFTQKEQWKRCTNLNQDTPVRDSNIESSKHKLDRHITAVATVQWNSVRYKCEFPCTIYF